MAFSTRKPIIFALLAVLVLAALPACSTGSQTSGLHMLPIDQMPQQVQAAPSVVSASYQFAAANPDVLQGIPCYCGCGNAGHTSNYSCYIQGSEQGKLKFDDHALGCSLCVSITQDAMRLLQQGKTVPEIKAYVDATYSKYGPSNMP
jgi:uncharacterized protein with PCYCGC motif